MSDVDLLPIPKSYARTKRVEFWGQPAKQRTTLAKTHIGDGNVLLWITTINNRPSGWLIRVDSSWAKPGHDIHDTIEEALTALEEEFGRWSWRVEALECEDGLSHEQAMDHSDVQYPCVDAETGYSWNIFAVRRSNRWVDPARAKHTTTEGYSDE